MALNKLWTGYFNDKNTFKRILTLRVVFKNLQFLNTTLRVKTTQVEVSIYF